MPLIPGWLKRLSWQTVAVAAVTGGIVHIMATLVLPQFARATAFQRIASKLSLNAMHVLPPATPDAQLLPFLSADERIAVCKFDIEAGPVDVTAVLPEKGWSLGLYTASGDNFYVIPAQDMRRFEVALTLVPAQERFFGTIGLGKQVDLSATQVQVPTNVGYVVVRGMSRGRSYTADIEQTLKKARCVQRKA